MSSTAGSVGAGSGRSSRLSPMIGRDPQEKHRAATPLELLFDLTFVVAFAFAANGLAHAIGEGHVWQGLAGFWFAMFATVWAWINYAWFASAFDNDDWAYRLLTMLQMIGVLILALGIPPMFDSMEGLGHGGHIENSVMVLGYVVMRVAMVGQWVRVGTQSPEYARSSRLYVAAIGIAQIGWVATILVHISIPVFAVAALLLTLVELAGPYIVEGRQPTPWHPHHIAERYSLLAIIALGEGITGSVAALSAVVGPNNHWTWQAAVVGLAGVGITFGLWWTYFTVPYAEVLEVRRNRSFGFGYGHVFVFMAIAAVGAGLHVAALQMEQGSAEGAKAAEAGAEAGHHISTMTAVLSVVIPVAIFTLTVLVLWSYMLADIDRFHLVLYAVLVLLLALPVVLAALHVSTPICLLAILLAPLAIVVAYERIGVAHTEERLSTLESRI